MNGRATAALSEAHERFNFENGPVHMGEPVVPGHEDLDPRPLAYTNASQLFYLSEEEGEAKIFAKKEEAGDVPIYTHPPKAKAVPEGWKLNHGHGIWEVVKPNGKPVAVPAELSEFFEAVFGDRS